MPSAGEDIESDRGLPLATFGMTRRQRASTFLARPLCALLLVLAFSTRLNADSYSMSNSAIVLDTRGSVRALSDAGIGEIRSLTPHWNSSLLLDAGGEDIQLQITRAIWGRIRQGTARHSVMFLPPGSAGIVLFAPRNRALEPDFFRDVVVKVIRKALYPSRLGKKRNPPRCRHNPDGPGCG